MSESEIWIGNIYKSIEFICPYCKKDFGNTSNMTIEEYLDHKKNCKLKL